MVKIYSGNTLTDGQIAEIAGRIREGAVAILPTETVYGLFCRYDLKDSAERIYNLKRRPREKLLSLTLANLEAARDYFDLEEWQLFTLKELLPGPVTFVLKPCLELPKYLVNSEGKTGLRIPDQPLVRRIIEQTGYPLASTSANFSGEPAPGAFKDISTEIVDSCEVAVDAGECTLKVASTVYDLSFFPGMTIREGAVNPETIIEVAERFYKK
jgi:L-threonylcarbamoyladenylate synthase